MARGVLALSLAVWVASLPTIVDAPVSQYGLLATAGPTLVPAALGVAIAFVVALRAGSVRDCVAAVVGLVAVTRATACIIVPLPIYEWTFKHIGVTDALSSSGHLARDVDIYNSWPGFFSSAAWFTDLTGVPFTDVARWFPVATDLALALGMYAVSRAFGHATGVALTAAFGMQVFNWVAQDYYSPQATAFVLALAVIALLLRSRADPRAAWFTVPLIVAITVTHQLTPFWLCGIAVLLGLTKRIRPRFIAVVFVVVAVAYAAANFSALSPYGLLTGFDPLSNAQSNVATAGNAGRSFTSLVARGTSALMWLSALACAWRARRHRDPVWAPAVLAFTSFALLAGQSYGGEAIFRVFLYSIPGCMLLIAPVLEAAVTGRRGGPRHRPPAALTRLLVAGVTIVALFGSLQAYYGTWFVNVVDRDGLQAQRTLLATAPTDSLIVGLSLGIAERPTGRYVAFARSDTTYDNPLVLQKGILSSRFTAGEVRRITADLRSAGRPVYLIVTEQMRRYSTYYGLFPPGAVDRLVRSLATSSQWTTVTDTPTLSIFKLAPA